MVPLVQVGGLTAEARAAVRGRRARPPMELGSSRQPLVQALPPLLEQALLPVQ